MVNERMPEIDLKAVPYHSTLRIVRMAAGKTQEEIARKAKINRSRLSLFESGFLELSPRELARLESALDKQPINHKRVLANIQKVDAAESHSDSRRLWRQMLGLSQHEVARAIGVPQSRLSEWERGRLEITPEQEKKWNGLMRQKTDEDPWFLLEMEKTRAMQLRDVGASLAQDAHDAIKEFLGVVDKLLAEDSPTLNEEQKAQRRTELKAVAEPIIKLAEKLVAKVKDGTIKEEGEKYGLP